jgi:hypothetical protein
MKVRSRALGWLIACVGSITAWVLLERLYPSYWESTVHHSILSAAADFSPTTIVPFNPTTKHQTPTMDERSDDRTDHDWIFGRVLNSRDELEQLLDEMKASGVTLRNSPYRQLRSEEEVLNYTGPDGCLRQKPNLRRYIGHIRSLHGSSFDPISFFYADPNSLTPRVKAFLDRYAFRKVQYTTNAAEERVTLPINSKAMKIVVAGDSVPAGSMIDDAETVASHLQRLEPNHEVINIGITGADPNAALCSSDRAARRYPEQISTFIFFWTENDFDGAPPMNEPNAGMRKLREYAKENKIARVIVVYSPYIYNTVPELTRIENVSDKRATYIEQYQTLRRAAIEQNFVFLNIAHIAEEVRKQSGTLFGPLAMYVDHAHLSEYGSYLVARELARHILR